MKLISDYLENEAKFARMAAEETDAALRASLEELASAYRKLAEKRARELNLRWPFKRYSSRMP